MNPDAKVKVATIEESAAKVTRSIEECSQAIRECLKALERSEADRA
jgi:hypothetical protein